MAVYTPLTQADAAAFLAEAPALGGVLSLAPITAGIQNTNYDIATERNRFVLTLYEKESVARDLPFFCDLLRHLAARGLAVAEPMLTGTLKEKKALLCRFLPGQSLMDYQPGTAEALGSALADLHLAVASFSQTRQDKISTPAGWHELAEATKDRAGEVEAGLGQLIAERLARVTALWPKSIAKGVIHSDLFPDNVLWTMDGATPRISGLIDFYNACDGFFAYDIAVTLNAWAFDDGNRWRAEWARAFMGGYEKKRALAPDERAAMPLLLEAAALRFLLSRLHARLFPPRAALLVPKDPLVFAARLRHHAEHQDQSWLKTA